MGADVAITGIGWITSIGCNADTVRESLLLGRSGIRPVSWFENCPVKVAGTIPEFEVSSPSWTQWRYPESYSIRRDALRSLSPHGVYAICSVLQAIAAAGIEVTELSDPHTGLFCASAGSPFLMHHHLSHMDANGGKRGQPMGVVSSICGTLNFNLGAYFKIKGSNLGFVSACASSSHAIAYAMEEIRSGRQQRMVVVGAEEINAPSIVPFSAMRALSLSDQSDASRPFDRSRDGFVGTGGAVTLILESAQLAAKRRAPVLATLVGWGQSADGHNIAISHEQGEGLSRAMQLALNDARLKPEDIGYLNAHATSTQVGDRSEACAIRQVFAAHPDIPVSSTKALTGHALSMSGALETAICCLALQESIAFPQAHLREVDPECAHLNLPQAPLPLEQPYILSNSSGFGGSNVSLILRRE